ncbi:MAG TPA: hypothetical protein VNX67_08245 [Solirubrobacteraceae bacterium]|nr:hypothetical protein [Solirubrobacteraceae bacterium]
MQTHRDAQIVDWIGRLGAAGAEHVMSRFSLSRSVTYARLNSMVHDELLEHHAVLYARPGMYTATPAGLRWQGLESLGKFAVRPGGFEHAWQVAQAAVQIENGLAGWPVFSEREIRAVEANSGKLFASAKTGAVADRPALHRPDLAVERPGGKVTSIEIELSIKSSSRLAAICRGWARSRHIDRVYYLATPGPASAVKRAARSAHVTNRVRVLALREIPRLIHELTTGNESTETPIYPPRRAQWRPRQYQTREVVR